MDNKFNLKSFQILEKKFKTEISGYSAREVDEYLDKILEDYTNYEELLKLKNDQIEDRDITIAKKEEEIEALVLELKNTEELLKQTKASKNINVAEELKAMKKQLEELKD